MFDNGQRWSWIWGLGWLKNSSRQFVNAILGLFCVSVIEVLQEKCLSLICIDRPAKNFTSELICYLWLSISLLLHFRYSLSANIITIQEIKSHMFVVVIKLVKEFVNKNANFIYILTPYISESINFRIRQRAIFLHSKAICRWVLSHALKTTLCILL